MAKNGLMTEGSIIKQILMFSIPLLLGNLFQSLYNTIDSLIVGNFVGSTALAAVGANTSLINLIIGFFMGVSTGAGVLISQYYGAQKNKELSLSVHTFIALSILISVVLSIIGYFGAAQFLKWMSTPDNILDQATVYLKIYFAGAIFIVLYNAGSGILRAVGDSRRPLYFLVVSSVVNIFLDLFFVIFFKMGVAGVAWATVISQGVSTVLTFLVLIKSGEAYKLDLHKLSIDSQMLKKIIRIGIPSGIQNTIVSFSNVIVQTHMNTFGSNAIAGYVAANKFDNFIGLPMQSFALAITTFVGQNLGAGKLDRVKKGMRTCIILSVSTVVVLGIPAYLVSDSCISLFSKEAEVIYYGSMTIHWLVPFYCVMALTQVLLGALRGAGNSTVPMFISIFCYCIVRQVYLAIILPHYHYFQVLLFGYCFTWTLAAVLALIYTLKVDWLHQKQ